MRGHEVGKQRLTGLPHDVQLRGRKETLDDVPLASHEKSGSRALRHGRLFPRAATLRPPLHSNHHMAIYRLIILECFVLPLPPKASRWA